MKAKYISLSILIAMVVLGVVVLFIPSISMDRYVSLAKAVATVLIPLFISIGTNSAVEKVTSSIKKGS
jgi:poly-D-alanine transfer protein DltD